MNFVAKTLFVIALGLMTQSCGSASSVINQFLSLALAADISDSGTVASDGFVGMGTDLAVGDNNLNGNASGFYRFNNTGVPNTATVAQATLTTYQFNVAGTPFADLGPNVDTYMVDLGGGLDATDIDAYASGTYIGVISDTAPLGVRTLDVTAAVQAAVTAGATAFDFQFRFPTATDNNNDNDFANFVDPANIAAAPVAPSLFIQWLP